MNDFVTQVSGHLDLMWSTQLRAAQDRYGAAINNEPSYFIGEAKLLHDRVKAADAAFLGTSNRAVREWYAAASANDRHKSALLGLEELALRTPADSASFDRTRATRDLILGLSFLRNLEEVAEMYITQPNAL